MRRRYRSLAADVLAPAPAAKPAAKPSGGHLMQWAIAALGVGIVGAGVWFLWPKKARADDRVILPTTGSGATPPVPPETLIRPETPTPPPPLPPAAPSAGDPSTTSYWEQPPPPGRETVGPTDPIPSGIDYTLKRGESWSNIAERSYGSPKWWPFIFDANRTKFPNPDLVKPGDVIFVPDANRLPQALRDRYFARYDEHKRIWAAHRRSPQWGKSYPTLTPLVLNPSV